MSNSENRKPQKPGNSTSKVREPKAATSRKSNAKQEVTRWGTLKDWRATGKGKGKSLTALRNRLRDGT